MNKIQKFLREVDEDNKIDFSIKQTFWLRSVFGQFFKISWIKNWPEQKKLI